MMADSMKAERGNLAVFKVGKLLGEVAASRLKALYPAVEGEREVNSGPLTQAVSHLPQAAEQEVHRGSVVTEGNDGCHQPSFDQEGQSGVSRVGHVHGESFHVTAGTDDTPVTPSRVGGHR